ncbi:hypothetical protein Y032_0152g2853 [Ancylostoma ceylanicum]|uniref:Uncharacterized protein n=1 Tax=Ancylostoma ceylanicum TaxID=53326 RepID=A0A016T0F1_9BILA|nr:hypothetical protein Y032_0152g2853 [Ancylostoma ceylanicum]
MCNSPHRTHYVPLRNLAYRGKFSPTKKYSCETPIMDVAPNHFPQITLNPRRQQCYFSIFQKNEADLNTIRH